MPRTPITHPLVVSHNSHSYSNSESSYHITYNSEIANLPSPHVDASEIGHIWIGETHDIFNGINHGVIRDSTRKAYISAFNNMVDEDIILPRDSSPKSDDLLTEYITFWALADTCPRKITEINCLISVIEKMDLDLARNITGARGAVNTWKTRHESYAVTSINSPMAQAFA